MSEAPDTDWVHGRPEWWRSTAGRPPNKTHGFFGTKLDDGIKQKMIPSLFDWEIMPPKKWKLADRNKVGKGWMRQRFKPPARRILLPCSWSIFFMIATVVPLIFPGQTPNDQVVALILFLIAWSLVFFPAWMVQNEMPRGGGLLIGKNTIVYLSLGAIIFPLHILIDPKIGWISYAFFWGAWYSQIIRFQNGFSVPSNRWILPFDRSEWSENILEKNWQIVSVKWRNGPLATHSFIKGLELHGTSRSGERFITLHFHGGEGWLNDPFTMQMKSDKIHNFLNNPPVTTNGKVWNNRFLGESHTQNEDE